MQKKTVPSERSIACLALGLFLAGCSGMGLKSRAVSSRTFSVRLDWVHSALDVPNQGYRKINRSTPVIVGDLLISMNAIDGVVAFDRDSGQEKWRLPIINGIEGGATVIRERLFFGASDGSFYSVQAKTGDILWRYPVNAEVLAEPTLDGDRGLIYFVTSTNVVHALEADSGKLKWIYTRQDNAALAIRGGSRPVVSGNKVFVGFGDGYVAGLNAETGAVLWETLLNRGKKFRDMDASPVADGDRVYFAGFDDRLYCLSQLDGSILWRHEGGGYGGLTLHDGQILFPTNDGQIQSLHKETGKLLWSQKIKNGIATTLVPYKGLLVFGESQGMMKFIDPANGALLAEFEPGRGVFSAPRVDEKTNHVFFVSNESNVYALEAKWGQKPGIPYLAR